MELFWNERTGIFSEKSGLMEILNGIYRSYSYRREISVLLPFLSLLFILNYSFSGRAEEVY